MKIYLSRYFIFLSLISFFSPALATCLNPFGCAPKNLSECEEKAVKEAKSEYGARILISQCRETFPSVTASQCEKDAQAWVSEMRETAGDGYGLYVEPEIRDQCKKRFPSHYDDAKWATKEICINKLKADLARNERFIQGQGGFVGPAISFQCREWDDPYIADFCATERAATRRCKHGGHFGVGHRQCEVSAICRMPK